MVFFPAIKVHCWGGFGSQLFAVVRCWELAKRFPRRKIALVVHTSGVTKRSLEIAPLIQGLNVTVRDDFKVVSQESIEGSILRRDFKRMKSFLIYLLKLSLVRIGFISLLEDEQSFKRLKPWIISIRGHYTNLPISRNHLIQVRDALLHEGNALMTTRVNPESITIQYRLGDLLNLQEKSFINPALLTNVIFEELKSSKVIDITVLSDSPREAGALLDAQNRNWKVKNLPPIETIKACLSSEKFIGTNSKLSFWIAVFRALKQQKSALPRSFKVAAHTALDGNLIQNLTFFEIES